MRKVYAIYGWMCGWFFDIFNRCPENENMQNVIPFPFDVYDVVWWDDVDDDDDHDDDENAMFRILYTRTQCLYIKVQSCVIFMGITYQTLSSSVSPSLTFIMRTVWSVSSGTIANRYWSKRNAFMGELSIFVYLLFFSWIRPSKKKHYLFFNFSPLLLWMRPNYPEFCGKYSRQPPIFRFLLKTIFSLTIFIRICELLLFSLISSPWLTNARSSRFFSATVVIVIVVCFKAKLQMDFELCLAFILFFVVVARSIVQALLHLEFNDTIYPSVELQQHQRKNGWKLNARDRHGMTNLHKTQVEIIIKTSSFSIHFHCRWFYHSFRLVSSSHLVEYFATSIVSLKGVYSFFVLYFFPPIFVCELLTHCTGCSLAYLQFNE